ncbi:MAG: hypothetical protein AB7I48_29095, partial [Planctomycetaceae bacterium]
MREVEIDPDSEIVPGDRSGRNNSRSPLLYARQQPCSAHEYDRDAAFRQPSKGPVAFCGDEVNGVTPNPRNELPRRTADAGWNVRRASKMHEAAGMHCKPFLPAQDPGGEFLTVRVEKPCGTFLFRKEVSGSLRSPVVSGCNRSPSYRVDLHYLLNQPVEEFPAMRRS